jgi:ankyrin repeat protein
MDNDSQSSGSLGCQNLIELILLDQQNSYNELLEKNSALLQGCDSFGDTPLHIAVQKQKTTLAQKMISLGADVNKPNNVSFYLFITSPYLLQVPIKI